MDKAISIIKNKILELQKYPNIESFKYKILILKDILRELKGGK